MNGTMMDLMSGWVMAFTDVMEIVAIVLPVCGLCTAAVLLFAPKVGMFRVTLLPRRTESATAGTSPASSGDGRLDADLTGATPAHGRRGEYGRGGSPFQSAGPGALGDEFLRKTASI